MRIASMHLFLRYISLVLFLVCASCAIVTDFVPEEQSNTRIFNSGYDDTWDAVLSALGFIPLDTVDKGRGLIKTGWVVRDSHKEMSGFISTKSWKERNRAFISILSLSALDTTTEVSVAFQAEEKAPAGARGSQWKRIVSDNMYENDLFGKIERVLSGE